MLRKECPWCHNPIAMRLLGQRPTKLKYAWYQFTKYVKVCPYCANPVKPGGSLLSNAFFCFYLYFFSLYWTYFLTWLYQAIGILMKYLGLWRVSQSWVFFGCTNFKRMRPHSNPQYFSAFCVAPCVRIVVASNFCVIHRHPFYNCCHER